MLKKMKKGQILGVPLILIFGLIVGAFILLYGAKVILDLTAEADYIDFVDQMKDLDNNIATIGNYDVGTAKVYDMNLPKDVEVICFYDPTESTECKLDGKDCDDTLQATFDLVKAAQYNVYVFPQGVFEQTRLQIKDFKALNGNPQCISNGQGIVVSVGKDYVGVEYYAE
jgi:hypothetical protein